MKLIGIDISLFQGSVDWGQVRESDVTFAMIRCGWVGWDKQRHLDDEFHNNMKGAINVGIKVGVYIYSYAQTIEQTLEEAKFILDAVKDYKIDLPLVIDVEDPKDQAHLTPDQKATVIQTFYNAVTEAGYQAAFYTMRSWLMDSQINMKRIAHIPIWLAEWKGENGAPTYTKNVYMWQYTNKGNVSGIKDDVDLNYLYENNQKEQGEKEMVLEYTGILKKGSQGTNVLQLQQILNDLGYSCGKPDGIYGSKTYEAVKTFQKANGLKPVDGIYGTQTYKALKVKLDNLEQVDVEEQQTQITRTLKKGCKGFDVEQLQNLLKQWKIPVLPDGDFGKKTEQAVLSFQIGLGLVADGIIGQATLKYLQSPIINIDQMPAEKFRCKCKGKYCNGHVEDVTWQARMLAIRFCMIGNKKIDDLIITSGNRCYWHNLFSGGAINSQHKYWNAFDGYFQDVSVAQMNEWAKIISPYAGGKGMRAKKIQHLDGRKKGTIWNYN